MRMFTTLILILMFAGSCLAHDLQYFAGSLSESQLQNIERQEPELETFPMTFQDNLNPEELHDIEGPTDWRRRPPGDREPISERPENPVSDSPSKPRYPAINWFFNKIINLPIFREIGMLISDFAFIVTLLVIWFTPVYLLKWRMIWPLDLIVYIFNKIRESSNNTKNPFEE